MAWSRPGPRRPSAGPPTREPGAAETDRRAVAADARASAAEAASTVARAAVAQATTAVQRERARADAAEALVARAEATDSLASLHGRELVELRTPRLVSRRSGALHHPWRALLVRPEHGCLVCWSISVTPPGQVGRPEHVRE